GEAVLADEVPDTAAEGEPADADRSGVAEAGAEAVPCGRGGVLGGGEAGLSPRGTLLDVDLHVAEPGKVEHDAVADTMPGQAVAAAADGQFQPVVPGVRDDRRDLVRARWPHDG